MPDVFTKFKRSEVMGKIRSRGNKGTELRLAALFREHGITGWRRQLPLPGRPDFAFPKAKLAVFTDGCFWHGCPSCYQRPESHRGSGTPSSPATGRAVGGAENHGLTRTGTD